MTRSPALWVLLQGALLVGLTILLIQPKTVPDPFGVGPQLSWTALCVLASLPTIITAARRLRLPATRLDPYVWAYAGCCVLALPFSVDRMTSAVWLVALMADLLVFYAVVSMTQSMEDLTATLLLAVVAGVAVLELIAIDFHAERGLMVRMVEYDRPEGWSGYPELGYLACVQLAILLAIFQMSRGRLQRLAVAGVAAVTVVEVALLFSRLAWVTAIVLALVAFSVGRPLRALWRPVLATVVVVMLIGGALSRTSTGSTMVSSMTDRALSAGRFDIWERTGRMIADHPAGVGAGNFQAVFEPIYNPFLNNDKRRGGHAHNLWLQQAAENGLLAAGAYVALWIAVIGMAARRTQTTWIDRAAFLVTVAVAVRSMGDYMFFSTGGAPARLHTLLWLVWGIVGAAVVPTERFVAADAPRGGAIA